MADLNKPGQPANLLEEPRKLPDLLNVITILTFVGSGIFTISQFYSWATAKESYQKILDMQGKLDSMPDFLKKMMGPDMVEIARKSYENRTPMLLLTLVAYGLCVYGALQMRKFKRTGFSIYVIGEILPIVAAFIFVGVGVFGGFALISALLFPAVFIIMYATQLKYLS